MNGRTKINSVLAGGILFKARSYSPGGASVNCAEAYDRKVSNAARGLKDLQDIGRMILRRLDIEAAEKGQDAQFLCSAMREELREALRGCDGKDPRTVPPSVQAQHSAALDVTESAVRAQIGL